MESYNRWPLGSGFFHWVCFQGSMCSTYQYYFIAFYGRMVSQCMARPHFVYLFTLGWAFGWFPLLAHVNCDAMSICVQMFECLFLVLPSRFSGLELLDHIKTLLKKPPTYFLQQLHHFTFFPLMREGSNLSKSLSTPPGFGGGVYYS